MHVCKTAETREKLDILTRAHNRTEKFCCPNAHCHQQKTLDSAVWLLWEGGFGISRVAGLTDFAIGARASGILLKMFEFSGFKHHKGYQNVKFIKKLLKLRPSGFSSLF